MLSLISSTTLASIPLHLHLGSNFIKIRKRHSHPPIHLFFPKNYPPLLGGFKQTTATTITRSRFSNNDKQDEDSFLSLEKEILNFMNINSLIDFPTKKQLLDAGRLDLVHAISNSRGSWLALGWDLTHDDDLQPTTTKEGLAVPPTSLDATEEEEDTGGVQGILARLKKHRTITFDLHKKENNIQYAVVDTDTSTHDNPVALTNFHISTHMDKSAEQGTWRIPGKYLSDFQAAEIDYGKEDSKDKTLAINHDSQFQEKHEEINPSQIRSRLHHMQLELSSVLCSLRFKSQTLNSEVHDSSASELQQLSDVWEFQENELMKAEDKLRSIRTKIAVFEGKIALSVIDTQKLVEEKQRRIDSARRTLQLLRTTCIFWTHSASDVLLVGSFDGWTSQIKMEKTRTGIFSVSLKLYPGRYEIKYIVDGIWRVDPMLPVVRSNGYENNSIFVRE